jgi:probable rRNA maturation factor
MINVEIKEAASAGLEEAGVTEAFIILSAQTVLEYEGVKEGELTILITDDEQMQKLNQEYRQVELTTDVLAFPAGYTDPDTSSMYLGDVIISCPRAAEQAASGGHPLALEIQLLTIHGVLHLLGYDDEDEYEKERMWAVQSSILTRLNNPLTPA